MEYDLDERGQAILGKTVESRAQENHDFLFDLNNLGCGDGLFLLVVHQAPEEVGHEMLFNGLLFLLNSLL